MAKLNIRYNAETEKFYIAEMPTLTFGCARDAERAAMRMCDKVVIW